MAATKTGALLWRLPVPATDQGHQVAVTLRTDRDPNTGAGRVWVAVGSRYRRLPLTVPEAWALFRLLAEALDTAGEPPEFIRAVITPTEK
jgi:hypothetical protein